MISSSRNRVSRPSFGASWISTSRTELTRFGRSSAEGRPRHSSNTSLRRDRLIWGDLVLSFGFSDSGCCHLKLRLSKPETQNSLTLFTLRRCQLLPRGNLPWLPYKAPLPPGSKAACTHRNAPHRHYG